MQVRWVNKKSLYKAITWRLISIVLSFIVGYIYLGSVKEAGELTVIYSIISTVLYYFHELFYKWLRKKGKI